MKKGIVQPTSNSGNSTKPIVTSSANSFMEEVEAELEKLRIIVTNVESMDDAAKYRTMGYLSSRFSKYMPTRDD
jgi:hypothetical protein